MGSKGGVVSSPQLKRASIVAAAVIAIGGLCVQVMAQSRPVGPLAQGPMEREESPKVLQQIGIDQRLNEQIPLDLAFRDEEGREVQLRQFFGKRPVVLSLVYYECPMLCSMVLNGVLGSLKPINISIGTDFEVVTVSFDPRETPELAKAKKAKYVAEYGRPQAAEGWHFLTGSEESIKQLTEAVGFRYTWDENSGQWAHSTAMMILTPEGRLAQYYYGLEYPPKFVRLALVEASGGKIGSFVDEVLLYCFEYDPSKGKYGLVIMSVVRIAGMATLLLLGTFMLVNLRRERHGGT